LSGAFNSHAANLAPVGVVLPKTSVPIFARLETVLPKKSCVTKLFVVSYLVAENRAYTSRQAVIPSEWCGALDSCGSSAAIADVYCFIFSEK
jgi:hypothetical protein